MSRWAAPKANAAVRSTEGTPVIAMHGDSEATLLSLWEAGQARHPIDRSLLLCAWARPDLAPEQLEHLPLGAVNAALLQLRSALFGPVVDVQLECAQCGEQLETRLSTPALLAGARTDDEPATIDVQGFAFRLPDSRDLAAITREPDTDAAAHRLLQRCCMGRPDGAADLDALMVQAEEQLESADPLADMQLDVACHACGHCTPAALDPGTVLWTDVQRHARSLLEQVHALARAYGWTEREVLALSATRRAAYLDLATG